MDDLGATVPPIDDVTRFWREEKEKGAIYNVYLKKVTYHTLSDLPVRDVK
uniref:Uncharacterized protein n=1 Tax=Magallana gigas TaxID=29159 RepID=K1QEC3_MAGGI